VGVTTEKEIQAIVDQLRHDRTAALNASSRRR
jgi:hypothetical protein